jgi:hypothetical protein
MVDVRRCIERFVELFNRPGSPVYEMYSKDLDWVLVSGGAVAKSDLAFVSELEVTDAPMGASSGYEELMHDLRLVRGITKEQQERGEYAVPPRPGMLVDIRIPSVRHVTIEGNLGVLECTWTGTPIEADGRRGKPILANMVFILRFNEEGLITMDHDYWMPIG